jgi:hypothetical protein
MYAKPLNFQSRVQEVDKKKKRHMCRVVRFVRVNTRSYSLKDFYFYSKPRRKDETRLMLILFSRFRLKGIKEEGEEGLLPADREFYCARLLRVRTQHELWFSTISTQHTPKLCDVLAPCTKRRRRNLLRGR